MAAAAGCHSGACQRAVGVVVPPPAAPDGHAAGDERLVRLRHGNGEVEVFGGAERCGGTVAQNDPVFTTRVWT